MDIKDRLEQLKRERRNRPRGRTVEDAWRKIDSESDLSVKDKLQKLISLTGQGPGRSKARTAGRSDFLEPEHGEPVQIIQTSYNLKANYGRTPIGLGLEIKGDVLSCLSRSPESLACRITYDNESLGQFLNTMKLRVGAQQQQLIDELLLKYQMMEPIASSPELKGWQAPDTSETEKQEEYQKLKTFNPFFTQTMFW